MAVNARFQADFTSFYDAVQKAELQLKSFETGAVGVEKQLNKIGNSFSGTKVIQEAHLMTAALANAGGTSGLTDKELRKLNATVTEASEKMKKLGMEVPPRFKAIASETEIATRATKGWVDSFFTLHNIVQGFLALKVVSFVKQNITASIEYANQLSNLHAKTDISFRDLQILEDLGRSSGVSIDQLAAAVQTLQQRLGDRSARKGIQDLGLSFDRILALSPAQQFAAIGAEIAKIEDPEHRAAAAAAVFGKTWKEMMPLLRANMAEAAAGAKIVGDAQIKAANAAGERWDKFWSDQKRGWTSWVGDYLLKKDIVNKAAEEQSRQLAAMRGELLILPTLPAGPSGRVGLGALVNDVDPAMISNLRVAGRTLEEQTKTLEKNMQMRSEWARITKEDAAGAEFKWQRDLALTKFQVEQLTTLESRLLANRAAAPFTSPAVNIVPTIGSRDFSRAVSGDLFGPAAKGPGAFSGITASLSKFKSEWLDFGKVANGVMTGFVEGLGHMLSGGVTALLNKGIEFLGKGIARIFGKSEESSKVSPLRDEFFKMAGGLDVLNPKVYALTGNLNAVEAIFKAKTVDQYNTAIQNLTGLLEFQDRAMEDLTATAQKYGFTLAELGPTLRRQELDKQAQQLYKDFQILTAGGLDHIAILGKMSDSVNAYINSALSMGVEVPEAMRPMLEEMARSGLLLDLNGEKIEDLEAKGISWSMTMSEGFKALITEVQKLTDAISRGLGLAIANIPDRTVTIHAKYDIPSSDLGDFSPGFANGTRGRLLDFGSGTRVTLHGKEQVRTAAEVAGDKAQLESIDRGIKKLNDTMLYQLPKMMRDEKLKAG